MLTTSVVFKVVVGIARVVPAPKKFAPSPILFTVPNRELVVDELINWAVMVVVVRVISFSVNVPEDVPGNGSVE